VATLEPVHTLSKVLEPTKMTIVFRQEGGMMSTETCLDLGLEPIQLTIGFKHIDFANIVMAQLQTTAGFINKLKSDIIKTRPQLSLDAPSKPQV